MRLTDHSARQNQRDSLLLRLPPEIRNQIFEWVIGAPTLRIRRSVFPLHKNPKQRLIVRNSVKLHPLALLSTCRQIFAETALLSWTQYIFESTQPDALNMRLTQQEAVYRGAITKLKLQIGVYVHHDRFQAVLVATPLYPVDRWTAPHLPALRQITISPCGFTNYGRTEAGQAMRGKYREMVEAFKLKFSGVCVHSGEILY